MARAACTFCKSFRLGMTQHIFRALARAPHQSSLPPLERAGRLSPSPRALTAIALWMNLASNSPFLVDVAPVPSIEARPRLSTSATASYTPSPTTPGSIQVKLVRQEALGSNACKLGF